MISQECSIEEFVKAVKEKDSYEVIRLAVQEATKADRIVLKKWKNVKTESIQTYSRQLKQLIDYHRYMIKPRRKAKTVYKLYMKYWGGTDISTDHDQWTPSLAAKIQESH